MPSALPFRPRLSTNTDSRNPAAAASSSTLSRERRFVGIEGCSAHTMPLQSSERFAAARRRRSSASEIASSCGELTRTSIVRPEAVSTTVSRPPRLGQPVRLWMIVDFPEFRCPMIATNCLRMLMNVLTELATDHATIAYGRSLCAARRLHKPPRSSARYLLHSRGQRSPAAAWPSRLSLRSSASRQAATALA